jgi:hypothetical protein
LLASNLPSGVGEAKSGMEVAGDELRSLKDRIRRPGVPVKQPELTAAQAGRGSHHHLPWEEPRQPGIVIPEDHLDMHALHEQGGEKVEQDPGDRRRCPDDRVLHVTYHDDPRRIVRARDPQDRLDHRSGGALREAETLTAGVTEAQVEVREDDFRPPFSGGREEQDGVTRHWSRPQGRHRVESPARLFNVTNRGFPESSPAVATIWI